MPPLRSATPGPLPGGLRDALITLIENNTAKVKGLVKCTGQL